MEFKANNKKIKDVLFTDSNKFRIPRYQRPYSWGPDQINEFWSDLTNDKESYFLGGFILNYESEKEGYIDVIDGQQRILTITIFQSVLRDICKDIDKNLSDAIQKYAIGFQDPYDLTYSFKVEVGDSTKQYFEKYIQNIGNNITINKGGTKEEKNIYKNYMFFYNQVNKIINDKPDKDSKINWINNLRRRLDDLNVIKIEIQSEEDAYEIFETTNARGVDLSVSDLLKNAILKNIKNDKKEKAKNTWEQITKNIENSNTELKKFIRYFWLSKYSFVTDKKLFKAIKNQIGDKGWEELLNELEKDSINWLKINEVNESDFSENTYESKIFKPIEGLHIMKVEQCNVFLLSILRNINKIKTNPSEVIEFIENFTFQYSAICKLPGNKVEKLYSKYAVKVDKIVIEELPKHISGKIQQSFRSMIGELKDLLPKNEDYFIDNFNRVTYKKKDLSRYILTRINNYMELTNEKSINFNNVNIEHILPQNPIKWGLKQKDVISYVHLLGNLTLLHDGLNRTVGNDSLPQKLIHLKKSQLEITKDFIKNLIDENTWTEDDIKKRQLSYGRLAYDEIWNIKK